MDPTAMMNPMGFGPGMVGGMAPGFGAGAMPHGPRGGFVLEKAFPVVRLRGLPFNAGEADVLEFFAGLEAVDALVVRRDGRTTGEAYVVFSNAVQMDFALQKNRAGMGRRYIEVFRSKKAEYYHAVAAAVAEAQTNGGAGAFASARDARADATAAFTSASSQAATLVITRPSMGEIASNCAPDFASTSLPSIRARPSMDRVDAV